MLKKSYWLEVGDGRAEGPSATGDGGQAAISLMPDMDGKHVRPFESSQFEGSCRELTVYVLNIFFFRFFSIIDDCKVWTIVPCAVYWCSFALFFSVPFFLLHLYILNFNWNNTKETNLGIAKACFSVLWLVLWKHTKMTPYTIVVQSCLTLCGPEDFLSFIVSQSLLKLMSIESVMLSNHLVLCHPHLLLPSIFPSIKVSFQWVGCSHQVAKVLEFQLQSFQWMLSVDFLKDWLVWSPCCSRDSQDSSPAPQFESISSSTFSLLDGPTLTSVYDYWKNHGFD